MEQFILNIMPYFLITIITFFKIWLLEKLFGPPVFNLLLTHNYPINIMYVGYFLMIIDLLCRLMIALCGLIFPFDKIMYINFVLSLVIFGIFYLLLSLIFKLSNKIGRYLICILHIVASVFGTWLTGYHLIKILGYIK